MQKSIESIYSISILNPQSSQTWKNSHSLISTLQFSIISSTRLPVDNPILALVIFRSLSSLHLSESDFKHPSQMTRFEWSNECDPIDKDFRFGHPLMISRNPMVRHELAPYSSKLFNNKLMWRSCFPNFLMANGIASPVALKPKIPVTSSSWSEMVMKHEWIIWTFLNSF